jgi:hypothetical protein
VLLRLSLKNLTKHKLRLVLTGGALAEAIFLMCVLQSLVVALDAGVRAAKSKRLIEQSAVSLFDNQPEAYEEKMRAVEGVELLLLARRRALSIREIPVTWKNDDRSRVDAVGDSWRMLRALPGILRRTGRYRG